MTQAVPIQERRCHQEPPSFLFEFLKNKKQETRDESPRKATWFALIIL